MSSPPSPASTSTGAAARSPSTSPANARGSPSSLRRVKVLHILPALFGGGMERVTLEIMRASSPAGGSGDEYRITHGMCILRDADDRLLAQCKSLATTWLLGRRQSRDWGCWRRLRQVIRDFEPDVIEALSTGTWCDAVRAARGRKRPRLILSFHGQTDPAPPGWRRRWVNRWAAKRADALLSVSDEATRRMREDWRLPADRLRTIPNGVDTRRFRPISDANEHARIRGRLDIAVDAPLAICVSNLRPIKAIDVLLESWKQVVSSRPDAHLLIVGDGPMRDQLRQLSEGLKLTSSIRFLGNREDVPVVLRAADLFVSSSRYEACSVAILEAMASGLPVVATNVGGTSEIVIPDQNGWLVPPDRADMLSQAIGAALANASVRRACGQTAHAVVEQRYGLAQCARQYAALYRSLALSNGLPVSVAAEESECAE